MPDLVTVGLCLVAACPLPLASCAACPMPHSAAAAAACFLRMWQKFCVCFVAAFLRVLSKKFFVDFGACGKGNVQQQLEWWREGNRACAKNRSILLCESKCAFCLRTLDSCRAVPCLLPANSVQSSINCLPRPFPPPVPFACLHSIIPLPVGCMRCTLICTHSFDVQKLSASFSVRPPPPSLPFCLSFDELILAVSYNKTFLIPTFLI